MAKAKKKAVKKVKETPKHISLKPEEFWNWMSIEERKDKIEYMLKMKHHVNQIINCLLITFTTLADFPVDTENAA